MQQIKVRRMTFALILALVLAMALSPVVNAANALAPAAQDEETPEATGPVSSTAVSGTITGGQFAKIWLGLTVDQLSEKVKIISDWDRVDPASQGLGFYILTPDQLNSVLGGTNIREAHLATGGPLSPDTPENQLGAEFQPSGKDYTLVVFNDSNSDANFSFTAQNALISDGTGVVRDMNSAPEASETEEAAAEPTEEAAADTTSDATVAVTSTVAPAATATPAATPEPTDDATPAAPAVAATPGVVRAQEVSGALDEENAQHYLALEPSIKDGKVDLLLTFDPQDSSELARRMNFWVLDENAWNRYQDASENVVLSNIATAAGSSHPQLQGNQRSASFTSSGFGPYTVIVYNNSRVPATYSLRVDGGILVDDDNQTTATGGVTSTVTGTVAAGSSAVVTATTGNAATTTNASTSTSSGVQGEAGGDYTVQAGDTLSIIARDIYGDIGLWEELCSFNNLTDCNAIEVGQVLRLPTRDEIGAVGAAPVRTPTPAATTASTTTTSTTTTEEEEPTATPEPEEEDATSTGSSTTVTDTEEITATTPVTGTEPVSESDTPTETESMSNGSSAGGGSVNLIAELEAEGNFTTLVEALQAAGLDDALSDAGPFTIFAPTDAAFAALPSGAVDQLLSNPTGQLTQILLFHVLPGKVMAEDVTDGMQATTQQGKAVNFEVANGDIKVNGANVVVPDLEATNGVVHAIDAVILPPSE